jgi:anti-anti-sigma regulatory factor
VTHTLPSSLTLSEVAAEREKLLLALESGDLALDASGVTEVDVAGLQLLESAHRTALARGHALRFVAGGRAALEPAAAALGLRLAADPTLWREVVHG